ncbi:MAG: hypothetical protein ACRCYO_15435 [Bacteroidia bacterium]
MSKNRIVTCTVINNSGYDLTYNTDVYQKGQSGSSHGSFTTNPVKTLGNNQSTLAFAVKRANSVSAYGSTGWVSYNLGNNQGIIYFMFNNPNSYDGSGNNSNCWFYPVIQGLNSQSVDIPLSVYATMSGFTFNATNPTDSDTMNITVTIHAL